MSKLKYKENSFLTVDQAKYVYKKVELGDMIKDKYNKAGDGSRLEN